MSAQVNSFSPRHPEELVCTATTMSTIPFGLAATMAKSTLQARGKFEGTTTFSLSPAHTYRYVLSLDNGQLRIALEDCDSKKQWCTKGLDLENYVDGSNSIPDAHPADYAKCFHELLSTPLQGTNKPPRALRKVKDHHILLEFYVKVQALMKSKVVAYTFNLEPISVKRIDVLEAKLCDLQAEVKLLRAEATGRKSAAQEMQTMISDLRAEMKSLCGTANAPAVFLARATSQLGTEGVLHWRCEGLKVIDGVFIDLNPGIFQVSVTVDFENGHSELQLNKCTQPVCSTSGSRQLSLASIVHVHKGDRVSVQANGNVVIGYMTLALLAKLAV